MIRFLCASAALAVSLVLLSLPGGTAHGQEAITYSVTGVALDDVLNIRQSADPRAPIVGVLAPGESGIGWTGEEVYRGSQRWVKIRHNRVSGWVNAAYLAEAARGLRPVRSFRVVGVAADDVLNVRAGPGVQAPIVGTLAFDATGVTIGGAAAGNGRSEWVEITHGPLRGWVNARYLAAEPAAAPPPPPPPPVRPPQPDEFADAAGDIGKRVALVIGNGAYPAASGIPALPNPTNDGRALGEALSRLGFDVIEVIDADLSRMRDGLRSFGERSRDAEIALFFFAGHGLQVNGENYLLPVSARIGRHEDVLTQSLSLSEVMDVLEEAAPQLSMVILDACRNNPLTGRIAQSAAARGLERVEVRKGLARRKGLPGMLIAYSTDPDNVALDGKGANSPFTAALLEEINEPELELRLMFGEVREAVVEATEGAQTPWVEEAVIGRFYFRPPPKIRESRYFGVWDHEHYTLKVAADRVELAPPPYSDAAPRTIAAGSADCGDVYERSVSRLAPDELPRALADEVIDHWARSNAPGQSILMMRIVCGYGSHIYYLLLAPYERLLLVEFSEQDFLMREGFYRGPR